MKRSFDLAVSLLMLILLLIPMLLIALMVKLTSRGPILHQSFRVGQNNQIFKMPKFRTMTQNTPPLATHLLENPDVFLTPIGSFLRRFSLDEIPQLISIIKGDMSLVGPRPALFNQDDLIDLRTKKGIHKIKPGLTGWAQVNGRDELPIPIKVKYDEIYAKNQSMLFDIKVLLLTFLNVVRNKGIQH